MSGAIHEFPPYVFMAWTGTVLHKVVLIIGMHYVANCWRGF